MGIDLAIFGFNRLERTDFKTAFASINRRQEMSQFITNTNKFQLMAYYTKEYLRNPAYINSSLLDTVFAFFSFYMIPRAFESLYDYIHWDETVVNNLLINKYDWEVARDIDSTWRIGDGTASFYNYIYYVMAGFSENDTFKSNQIREGMLSRNEAMRSVDQDNQPRYESIQWYCDTIGMDMQAALNVINTAPKLYPMDA
jgi:glucosamine--fructose-6-phosphate aminotransferase (isomerizing)